jgi:tagatose 1,6-diphosphate aldolase
LTAWTPSRARGVDEIAGADGIVVGAAADHRDALTVAMRRRGLPDPDPARLTELKLRIIGALAASASVVLLDAEHAAAQALAAGVIPGDTALVVPLEAQGYGDSGDLRLTSFLPGWDASKAAALGASGCKLLLPYRPDLPEQREPQAATARAAAAACHAAGIVLVLEPIVFARGGEELSGSQFAELVLETAAQLREVEPDLLKLQYPGDAAACAALDATCGPDVPWVLLGGGIDAETLERQVAETCAAGASGFIVGRTLFDTALVEDDEASQAALEQVSVPLLERLAAVARQHAAPWRSRVTDIPTPAQDWYR